MKNGIVIESNKQYHDYKEAISKSRLANMSRTPAYFKWCEDTPQEPTEDLIVGSAFHKLVLESNDFDNEFAILPSGIDRRTKLGKETYNQFVESNADKEIITQEQYEMICAMRDSLLANKYAKQLLNGSHEQSMYFIDNFTQILCKIRPDCYKIIGDRVIITDLKSCKSANAKDFMNDIVKYNYDLQAYMYRLGVSIILNVPIENISFVFICCEKKAPFLFGLYEATQDIFDRGEMLFREYIGMYKECLETNNWYGYNGFDNTPITIGLPNWVLKNNEEGE